MGSKTGWIISGAIVAVVIIIAGAVMLGGDLPGPTAATTASGAMDPIQLDVHYQQLVEVPEGAGKAAELYQQAASKFQSQSDPQAYLDNLIKNLNPQDDPDVRSVLDLVEEGSKEGMGNVDLVFGDPVKPSSKQNNLAVETLRTAVGQCAASYAADKKQDEAEKAYDALFVLGYRLFKNGIMEEDRTNGLAAMDAAAAGLAVFYDKQFPNPAKLAAAKAVGRDLAGPRDAWMEKEKIIHTVNANLGDLYYMARRDQDRTWRIEAVRWMGPLQWVSTSWKQRRILQAYLDGLTHGSDAVMAKAAAQARDTTQLDARQF